MRPKQAIKEIPKGILLKYSGMYEIKQSKPSTSHSKQDNL
jgi:hypothetical protein